MHRCLGQSARIVTIAVAFAIVASCGGGTVPKPSGKAQGSLAGVAVKGPVAAGTVRALKLSPAFERGEELASGATDADGAFSFQLPPYNGPLLVVVSSGTYIEEAIGLGVKLDGQELTALVPSYTGGAAITGLRVTPVSTLAVALAGYHVTHDGAAIADAHAEALLHLHHHFGDLDWSSVTPADLTVAGVTNLSPEARAGLVLSGLSWLSKQQAESSDVTPGLVVNAATLTGALARDADDGTLDGRTGAEQLKQAKAALSGLTLRADLVQAMTGFINSPRNASALRLQDITALLAAVGTNDDAYLFCPGQIAAATCGTGPVDTEPPTLAFLRPADGAGVAGSAQVEVRAQDNVKLKTLRFTAPASLVTTAATFGADGREGTLLATLDVSALPDGPVTIRAEVADEAGNPAARSVTVTVSNQGPRIVITAPGDGATVRGTSVLVSASATAQAPGASIAKLELVSPPPGMGTDTLPAADSFAAAWNSSAALEGAVTLTFRATDSFGTATEASVTTIVDNVPLGQVQAVVSAGAPVDGLTVRLLAIDEATGLPVTGRPGGAELGQSVAQTADGGVAFVLSQENYEGPAQVVAQGAAASYVDPSDSTTLITLPAAFTFTSYVAHYRTGDVLDVPVTYWTTLADDAARAYSQGRNPVQPTAVPLTAAMRVVDPLFAAHVSRPQVWGLRSVYPVRLTSTPQSLRDVVFAAFGDVGLNQLARDLAGDVGLTPGTGFGAPQLVAMLRQDVADGQFDGRSNAAQLRTAGTTPYELDTNTTRFRLAISLDRFVRGSQNASGLTRQDLQTSGIYDNVTGDTSLLYPATATPIPFDNQPPMVAWTVTYARSGQPSLAPYVLGTTKLVAGVVSIQADSTDMSGAASVTVEVDGQPLTPAAGSTSSRFRTTFDTSALTDGTISFTVTACDRLANCGTSAYAVDSDNTAPSVSLVRPQPGFYSQAFDIEALAADNQRVATFTATGVAGLVDQDASVSRVYVPSGTWALPLGLADGPLPLVLEACDVVRNCARATPPLIDRTPPSVAITSTVPAATRVAALTLAGTVNDWQGAGVARVLVGLNGAAPVVATLAGADWSAPLTLVPGANTIAVWAEDSAIPRNSGDGGVAPAVASSTVLLDMTPPSVSWNVTFANGGQTGASPIGASKLVAGTLAVRAVATDPSGVGSIAVAAGSAPLTAGAGSDTSTFLGTLDTTALIDGPLTLTATACDGLGNCGPVALILEADNTPPAVTSASPGPGYYSQSVAVDGAATDAHGVQSLAVQGLAGFVDNDSGPGRVLGTWVFPPGIAQGALTFSLRACDVLGNCATRPVSGVTVDTVAPSMALVLAPPQYTNQLAVDVRVSAAEVGAGVRAVYGKVQGGVPVAATFAGGSWLFSGLTLPGTDGVSAILVWGEDNASPPNSGELRRAPESLGASTLVDRSLPLPTVSPDSAKAFRDEDTLTVQLDTNGRPVVPVVYNQPTGPARNVDTTGMTIKRAATRLNSTQNRPTLTYAVPYVASSQAPIVGAAWTTVPPGCPSLLPCVQRSIGGTLTLTAHSSPAANTVYFELPLSLPLDGPYTITSTFTDAAGNSAVRTFALNWSVVGPPVVVVPDTAWEVSADPQSIYTKRVGDLSFSQLFGQGGTFYGGRVRVTRYLVYNPAPEAVGVALQPTAAARRTNETWNDVIGDLLAAGGPGSFSVDGNTFYRDAFFKFPGNPMDICPNVGNRIAEPYPCTGNPEPLIRHVRGAWAQYECFADAFTPPQNGAAVGLTAVNDADVAPLFFQSANVPGSGNETLLATRAVVGSVMGAVVPAASATAPGVTAVYMTVPVSAHPTLLSAADLPFLPASGRYQYYFADFWQWDGSAACSATGSGPTNNLTLRRAYYWYRQLMGASSSVSATWDVLTAGQLVSTSDLTGPYYIGWSSSRTLQTGQTFTRTMAH